MIDLHSHLLPAWTMAPARRRRAVGVLEPMAAKGVTDVCLTPHLQASQAERGPAGRTTSLPGSCSAGRPAPIRLHRGVELMLDRPLPTGGARRPGG